jgi:hypothetical protein
VDAVQRRKSQIQHVWNADGHAHFSREEARLIGRVVIHGTHGASGEELGRLNQLEQSAIRSNTSYGRQLIAQKYEEWQATQLHAPIERSAATGADLHPTPPKSVPSSPEPTPASTRRVSITPASSDRAMFDALVMAARNRDIDAMRSIGQQYLQSEQGRVAGGGATTQPATCAAGGTRGAGAASGGDATMRKEPANRTSMIRTMRRRMTCARWRCNWQPSPPCWSSAASR